MATLIERVRRPEYTGENRCQPCTIVNAVIGGMLAGALTVGVYAVGQNRLAAGVVGVSALVLSGAAIALRGYLVPGTPALTKRYLPESVLELFGKGAGPAAPAGVAAGGGAAGGRPDDADLDVETLLVDAGVLEPCAGGADLCLDPAFEEAWTERVRAAGGETRERLSDLLGVDADDVAVDDHGDAFRARVDGKRVGTWESRPAFEADLAAGDLLAERGVPWDDLDVRARGTVLSGLRLFLETCPDCGGPVSLATETRESCCSSHEVAAVRCEDCEVRLFETRA